MHFIPSLELSRMLYEEHIEALMADKFPDVPFAAASMGMCSECLELDDEISTDHEWGPRLTLYLTEADQSKHSKAIMRDIRAALPLHFKGYDMQWSKPGVDVLDTREKAKYSIWTSTVSGALRFCGGLDGLPMQDTDWLKVSEQHLLEFTNGVVYCDDIGDLTKARDKLAYYDDNVLRFLLTCDWNTVGGDWFPIGRIGTRGDQLGLHIQANKIAKHLMTIAFRVSRQYFPYKKWFGTMFKQLPIAAKLEPVLLDMVTETDWRKVEAQIGHAAEILLDAQNALAISRPITLKADVDSSGRHTIKYDFWAIGRELYKSVSPALIALDRNQTDWWSDRSHIIWNGEVGKLVLLNQK